MNILREVAKFVGWLSGALAGLGAILYTSGYLILKSHLYLLGLGPLIEYGNEQYAQEGGRFFFMLAVMLGKVFLLVVPILAIGVAVVYIVALMTRRYFATVLGWINLKGVFDRRVDRVRLVHERRPWLWRAAIFIVLAVLLYQFIANDWEALHAPLDISDLLFRGEAATNLSVAGSSGKALIIHALLNGKSDYLYQYFYHSVLLPLLRVGCLLALALWVTGGWRIRYVLAMPFASVFLIYLLALPLIYGVLIRPAEFARIEITDRKGTTITDPGELFLLTSGGSEFVVWNARRKRILWVPKSEVGRAEITQKQDVFKGLAGPAPISPRGRTEGSLK
jgi:hypothetical protein